MQLEQIAINLRPRNPWEALDLGGVLAAEWRAPALAAWCATYWVGGLFLLILLQNHLAWVGVLLWWLKPAFDRVLLHVYGQALFAAPPALGQTLRALPGLCRGPGLISALTLRRLSTARPLLLPVWQLEQQRGRAARQRFKVLGARCRSQAFWLTFFCANLLSILWLSLLILIQWLLPDGAASVLSWDELLHGELAPSKTLMTTLLWMVAETLVEPFYVASGFALYLNRRSELEGWDIELAFRRLSRRKRSEGSALRGFAGACLALALLLPATPGWAADAAPPPVRQTVDAVLAQPVFGQPKEDWEWRLIPPAPAAPNAAVTAWAKLLEALVRGLAAVGKGAVGLLAVIAAALFAYLLWRSRQTFWPRNPVNAVSAEPLFGFDLRPAALPADVPAAARAALARGEVSVALSLLYRGALSALIHQHQAEFRAGDTEDDCLRRSQPYLSAAAQAYFATLLYAWQISAYAGQLPPADTLERLCSAWAGHFGAPAE